MARKLCVVYIGFWCWEQTCIVSFATGSFEIAFSSIETLVFGLRMRVYLSAALLNVHFDSTFRFYGRVSYISEV